MPKKSLGSRHLPLLRDQPTVLPQVAPALRGTRGGGAAGRLLSALNSPNATEPEAVSRIVYLRSHYHFGPNRIAMYLERYHDITISPSGVWRILNKLGMSRLPASQRYKRHHDRYKRYEKQLPGQRVQVDVKFIQPIGGARRRKHYQFTAIDDCTRIRVLRAYPRCDQKTAIQFLDYLLERLPFQVQIIQTDNGAEFQGSFHWHVLDRGSVTSTSVRPPPPAQWEGREISPDRREEFHRLLEGVVIDDTGLFDEKLQDWEDFSTSVGPTAAWVARPTTND